MYRMSESEFMQYEMAEMRLSQLKMNHAAELQQAYDNIHPTRMGFDYHLGRIFSESLNPADYAIYLVEMREEHELIEKWWGSRATAFKRAFDLLTDEQKEVFNSLGYGMHRERLRARSEVKEHLETIVLATPELQRKVVPPELLEDLKEVDREIDNMSMDELMEDYWDRDDEDAAIASGV
ncbi:hypothetical protein [Pseudogracilibacillus auburnensis]|uniref:hypothetical protein n=1 Tax=Pseudogracilibacillus auburnensis TaxID=1494959 RepID=UPI001A965566|nr:hypothetical protein [Pseudogracilibacillus auburnensis]MBO1005777.1 hypothetical protein [Pseudogracilibacillus auburnensis]